MSALSAIQPVELRGKRALILEAAARNLNQRGVTQTFLAELGASVGVTRAALYYYFEDQQDLVFQCYRGACDVMARRLTEAAAGPENALDIIERFIDLVLTENGPEMAVLSETAYLIDEYRDTIVGLYDGLVARLAAIVRRGAERGEVRDCDPRLAALMILGVVSWLPLQKRWESSAPFSHARLAAAVKSLILEGVDARRAPCLDYEVLTLAPARISSLGVFDGAQLARAKQERLLAAASWLFNLKGVDATSLDEIAASVGVTKKVIYHNIGDKDAVVAACYRRSLDFAIGVLERAEAAKGDRLQAFCSLLHLHVEARLSKDVAPLSGVGGLDALPAPARGPLNERSKRLMTLAVALFEAGQAEGSLAAVDVGALMSITPGVVEWIPKWLSADTDDRRREIARELTTLYRLGLRPV